MLRVVAHTSAAAAHQYYAEGLKREDYYSEGQEVAGKWYGKAAKMLGLSGAVQPDQFASLVENKNPLTGEKLTPRTKAGRRVGYDLNFHAPKSLSVLYALTQDKMVLAAFRQAVADTMSELESLAETRVRKKGAQENRITGNLAWAEFVHFTSRPVGGIPDPHLHVHCFTFNASFDAVEGRWKAGEFAAIKREAHYAEAAFHSRLASSLQTLGYAVRRTRKGWELEGMPESVIAKFSRRTAQIERRAEELGIRDAKEKDALGAATREGKRHGMTLSDLLAAWSVRLTEEEKVQISKVCYDKGQQPAAVKVTPHAAMEYAFAKHFERQSVVQRGHILASALRYSVGQVSPAVIKAEFERREFIGAKVRDEHLCTSVDVLSEEIALLAFVRGGRNTAMALGGRGKLTLSASLSAEQKAAATHLLTSCDQVMAVRGGAGVGKTTMMVEVCAAIEKQGFKVFAFAPSAAASRSTLRESGFANAETVAHLLASEKLQKQVQEQVIWIDEAGLLGVRDLWRIMEIAGPKTRVILTGDSGQHAPVARGDAFRLLQKYAGLRIVEVSEIRRQLVQDYKEAISAISKGDLRAGFRRLEKIGAFVEIEDDQQRYCELAADYLALGKRGSFPLVVSPTHAESAKVTDAIRAARFEAGQLGPDRSFVQYHNLQWEEVERGVAGNYRAGLVVQFHQNAKGIKRGEMFRVTGAAKDGSIEIQNAGGRVLTLPLSEYRKFLVYEERSLTLAKGDHIRITRNGTSQDGRRLDNGTSYAVEKFGKKGEIILSNGAILANTHGHLVYGYCQTSHSAQSKSVRDVLVAQSKDSLVASSREQFYVSCSRGKETIRIYTDNRQQLQEAVGNTSVRLSGMELAGLTQKDVSSFMASELGGKQWREAVQSRRGLDGSKTFVKNLSEHRKTEPREKGEVIDWKGYVEMKRSLAGADGKSRSKGYPAEPGKSRSKGKSLPKTSEHSKAFVKRSAEFTAAKKAEAAKKEVPQNDNKPQKPEAQERKGRLAEAYKSAANHFRKVADKVKGAGRKPAEKKEVSLDKKKITPTQQGSEKRAASHAAKERSASIQKTGEGQKMAKEKARQAAPRPVVKK